MMYDDKLNYNIKNKMHAKLYLDQIFRCVALKNEKKMDYIDYENKLKR